MGTRDENRAVPVLRVAGSLTDDADDLLHTDDLDRAASDSLSFCRVLDPAHVTVRPLPLALNNARNKTPAVFAAAELTAVPSLF